MNQTIKGFSLTQPWATLVAMGSKQVETRSWSTPYRGWLAIHAAKGFPGYAKDFASAEFTLGRLPAQLPRGGIVALARLGKVMRTEALAPILTPLERLYGDYSSGRYGWLLYDVIALPEPIPCRGALSLWEIPADILPALQERLAGVVLDVEPPPPTPQQIEIFE